VFERLLKSTGEREISTTMAFVQALNIILRDKQVGPRCVPIVADEARTFGMEGLFRQIGIYAPFGQKYKPVDADQLMYYREDAAGPGAGGRHHRGRRVRQLDGAATSYSTNDLQMLPFYIFYSMFGFQRVGDAAWQAGDMRARGFLLGATAGRTTLNGEGLQHEDGHSPPARRPIPNCAATTRPSRSKSVILQHGMQRMLAEQATSTTTSP
jgi:pyruvate dehydrogenase E1 component